MIRSYFTNALLLVPGLMLLGLAIASGHGNATGIVKERMELMEDMGDATKGIVKMFKGETAYDNQQVVSFAQTINKHSKDMLNYFPEGSLQKASEALPAIWERWQDFETLSQQLQTESEKFIEVVASEDKGYPQAVCGCCENL